ncbi:hypothetical protein ACAG24_024200 [Mycobacterium sp. pW049]|uniref:hypothetical protein n=1 Tax=[Mycobacterium] bulgaricum TaxID=3238985 RepID=UPI00351BE4DF
MEFESREDAEEYEWEGRRHALAKLLQSRGAPEAAAIVAVAHYRVDYAGDDAYLVTLSIPAEFYDPARSEFCEVIAAACSDIVGPAQFGGVSFRVRTPDYRHDAEWIDIIVRALDRSWVASERVSVPALDKGF